MATDNASYEQSFSVEASAGSLLNFFFEVQKTGLDVANGSNLCPDSVVENTDCIGGIPNFWLGDAGNGGIWIALDDGGGGVDDNHDDLVILATAASVPEPSIIALFAAGLLGLGFTRRRAHN